MISKNFSMMLLSVLVTFNVFAGRERLLPVNAVDLKTDLQQFVGEDKSYYNIAKIKVKELAVNENDNYYFMAKQDGEKGLDEVIAIIDKIIVIGEKLWKIVEKGRPVVNTSTQKVSVLPYQNGQVMTAMELQNWSMPKFKKFNVTYENHYGMKVIEFTYLVQFTYGGNLRGAGKYLSNVTITVEKLNVSYGFDMDASSVINNVANHGTKENPVAGVTMQMGFKVKTLFQHLENTLSYHVTGDGKLLEM